MLLCSAAPYSAVRVFASSSLNGRSLALVSRRRQYVIIPHRASEPKPEPALASHLVPQPFPSQAGSTSAAASAASRRSAAAAGGGRCHECFCTRAYRRCSNVLRYRDAARRRASESATIRNFPGVVRGGELAAQGVCPRDLSPSFPGGLRYFDLTRTDHSFQFSFVSLTIMFLMSPRPRLCPTMCCVCTVISPFCWSSDS